MKAKRLEWECQFECQHIAPTYAGVYTITREVFTDTFTARRGLFSTFVEYIGSFDSLESAKDGCQRAFDRIWREMTEQESPWRPMEECPGGDSDRILAVFKEGHVTHVTEVMVWVARSNGAIAWRPIPAYTEETE
jgi:hypothetical protein